MSTISPSAKRDTRHKPRKKSRSPSAKPLPSILHSIRTQHKPISRHQAASLIHFHPPLNPATHIPHLESRLPHPVPRLPSPATRISYLASRIPHPLPLTFAPCSPPSKTNSSSSIVINFLLTSRRHSTNTLN